MAERRPIRLELPFADDSSSLRDLRAGDLVALEGWLYVARDQAHQRLCQALLDGEPLPIPLKGETIYYMGPTPAPEGRVIGSCGPTTSARMDPFTPRLLQEGVRCLIGKGPRSEAVREAIVEQGAIYLYAFGGCGALYARSVVDVSCVAYEDLGPEAIYRLRVSGFPAIVAIDASGTDMYASTRSD